MTNFNIGDHDEFLLETESRLDSPTEMIDSFQNIWLGLGLHANLAPLAELFQTPEPQRKLVFNTVNFLGRDQYFSLRD